MSDTKAATPNFHDKLKMVKGLLEEFITNNMMSNGHIHSVSGDDFSDICFCRDLLDELLLESWNRRVKDE